MLALLEEGDLRPTAQRIAERGRVARTVFHHYQDMESLLALVADTQIERVVNSRGPSARWVARPPHQALAQSAPASTRRSRRYSARRLLSSRSRARSPRAAVDAGAGRAEISRSSRPSCARSRRGGTRLLGVTAAASWSAWEALRAHQSLTPAQAKRVMTRTMRALLKEVTS
jgi:hypothetical protein